MIKEQEQNPFIRILLRFNSAHPTTQEKINKFETEMIRLDFGYIEQDVENNYKILKHDYFVFRRNFLEGFDYSLFEVIADHEMVLIVGKIMSEDNNMLDDENFLRHLGVIE